MYETNLMAKYDSRKSFYGKAKVIHQDNGALLLKSYDSIVAKFDIGKFTLNGDIKKDLLFSNTTLRHIKEFIQQNGGDYLTKKELEKLIDCEF